MVVDGIKDPEHTGGLLILYYIVFKGVRQRVVSDCIFNNLRWSDQQSEIREEPVRVHTVKQVLMLCLKNLAGRN